MSLRRCPVCDGGTSSARLFLDEHFDASRMTSLSFASRKPPEFMNLHLVHCLSCDLVYADSPPEQDVLARAYHVADFDSAEEAEDAAEAYMRVVRPLLSKLPTRESVLEIGAGTGVFLDRLAASGFKNLIGVEPSAAAIAAAPLYRRAWLKESIFDERDFLPASFDLICCFMTLEHVRDPQVLARAAARLLRPGGIFVVAVHDWRAPLNRLLGRRSPIVDIEHMQLFSRRSVERLFSEAGLTRVASQSFINRYSLRYWLRLTPLPDLLQQGVLRLLKACKIDSLRIGVNVGNRIGHGQRPRE